MLCHNLRPLHDLILVGAQIERFISFVACCRWFPGVLEEHQVILSVLLHRAGEPDRSSSIVFIVNEINGPIRWSFEDAARLYPCVNLIIFEDSLRGVRSLKLIGHFVDVNIGA